MTSLSVIIVGRNEARNIGRCIRSVLAATTDFADPEVVYVDSASVDQTVEIAGQFPIRILQLKPQWHLSPAAGRYTGYRNSRGTYLMFVDGDTVILKPWLGTAVDFLEGRPDVGGVAGIVDEACVSSSGRCVRLLKNRHGQNGEVEPVRSLGGIALYRRAAIEKAGPFNPYLTTEEEWELAVRIRSAGFKLLRINTPMCVTYAPPRETIREVLRRGRTGLYDFGTTLRYCLSNGFFWKFSTEQLWHFYTFIGALAITACVWIVALTVNQPWLLFAWALGAVAYVAAKRKGIKGAVVSLVKRCVVSYCTLISFIRTKPKSIDTYPTDVIVIK